MISNFGIKRFKCFEDIDIAFGKMTLLAGINGTGKTSVVQALLLLRQAFMTGDLENNKLPLNGDMVKIGKARDALFDGSQEDSFSFTTVFTGEPEEEFGWIFNYEKENPEQYILSGSSTQNILPLLGIFAPRFVYLTAERLGPRLIYPLSELSEEEMNVGARGEFTAHCLAKFGNKSIPNNALVLETDEGVANSTLLNQAQLWMRHFIPGITFNVEYIEHTDSVRLEVRAYEDQVEYLRPTNMGFGFSYTLPIIVAALMAEPGTMLIIENPEAHLHPAGQSQIAQFLCKVAQKGVQVIIETHSDHILNGIRISVKKEKISHEEVNIHYFTRGKKLGSNKVANLRIYKDGGIGNWPEGFFDQLEQDLEELFE